MEARAPNTVAFAIRGPISRADLPGLCDRVRTLLAESGAGIVVCDVREAECDAVTVDALARLQLAACRSGRRVQLRGACPELVRLVELMGLTDVLTPLPSSRGRPMSSGARSGLNHRHRYPQGGER